MLEISILKLLLKKENYLKYYNYLQKLSVDTEFKNLYKLVNKYYAEFPEHNYISLDELKAYFSVQYKGIKNPEIYTVLFDQVKTLEVSDSVGAKMIKSLIEKHYAAQIMPLLLDILEDRQSTIMEKLQDYIAEADTLLHGSDTIEQEYVTDDLGELLAKEVDLSGLQWRINMLNHSAAPVRGGNLIHAFARTDGGKTSFVMSEASHWARQLQEGEEGLWFNNEGAASKIKLRWVCAVLGRSVQLIAENREAAAKAYQAYGGHRVKMLNQSVIHINDVERHIRKIKPKFVIIDIGDKVKCRATKTARTDEVLGTLYAEFRALAIDYDTPIMTTGQANDEATGQKYLIENMMAASHTAKPGELDLAIGIGFQDKDDPRRYISLPKNKLNAEPEFTRFVTKFDKAACRFMEL